MCVFVYVCMYACMCRRGCKLCYLICHGDERNVWLSNQSAGLVYPMEIDSMGSPTPSLLYSGKAHYGPCLPIHHLSVFTPREVVVLHTDWHWNINTTPLPNSIPFGINKIRGRRALFFLFSFFVCLASLFYISVILQYNTGNTFYSKHTVIPNHSITKL